MNQLLSRIYAIVSDRGGVARAFKLALDRPAAVTQAVSRLAEKDWRTLAGGSHAIASKLRTELEQSGLIDALNARLRDESSALAGQKVRGKEAVPGGMRTLHAELLWVIVRSQNPMTIVETGVCNGLSSAVLLEAIEKNGSGLLVSVDLPEFTDAELNKFDVWDGRGGAAIPAGKDVGWLVRPDIAPHGVWSWGRVRNCYHRFLKGSRRSTFSPMTASTPTKTNCSNSALVSKLCARAAFSWPQISRGPTPSTTFGWRSKEVALSALLSIHHARS